MRLLANLCRWTLTAVIGSLPLTVSANEVDAVERLASMSAAMQTLNYEGTFVHIQNGHAELLHVLHAYSDSGESERMTSLNGEAREVIRNNEIVTCIWPGTNDVVVNRSKPRTVLQPVRAAITESSPYSVQGRGQDRVAGIKTDVVDIEPLDEFRYGYRFWIDQSSGMMLRSMVLDSNMRPVEEIMFTDIKYLDSVDPSRFDVDVSLPQKQWDDTTDTDSSDESPGLKPVVDKVQFEDLPAGFTERSESLRMMALRKDSAVSHVVVSDGISTISVYVEYVVRSEHDPSALGSTSMGAIHAFGLSLPKALVTAVGEAPGNTVEIIARAARLTD